MDWYQSVAWELGTPALGGKKHPRLRTTSLGSLALVPSPCLIFPCTPALSPVSLGSHHHLANKVIREVAKGTIDLGELSFHCSVHHLSMWPWTSCWILSFLIYKMETIILPHHRVLWGLNIFLLSKIIIANHCFYHSWLQKVIWQWMELRVELTAFDSAVTHSGIEEECHISGRKKNRSIGLQS